MKTLLAVFLFASMALSAQANDYKLVKVKTLGVMKNKVIFQSQNVKKVKNTDVVKGKLIAQWGTEVFEVATGYYKCNTKNVCRLTDFDRVATFKSCVVSGDKAKCTQKIVGDTSSSDSDRSISYGNPDEVRGDYDHDRRRDDYDSEFPVRIVDEYSDLF